MLPGSLLPASRPSVTLPDLNRNRTARTFELYPRDQFVQIHVMQIKQIGMLRFQGTEKFVQHAEGGAAKSFQRRMEVDGVHRDDSRDATLKAPFRQLHIF